MRNCVTYILIERKGNRNVSYILLRRGVSLDTLHVDHLRPLLSTKKSIEIVLHILVVIDFLEIHIDVYYEIYEHAEDIGALKEAGGCLWQSADALFLTRVPPFHRASLGSIAERKASNMFWSQRYTEKERVERVNRTFIRYWLVNSKATQVAQIYWCRAAIFECCATYKHWSILVPCVPGSPSMAEGLSGNQENAGGRVARVFSGKSYEPRLERIS